MNPFRVAVVIRGKNVGKDLERLRGELAGQVDVELHVIFVDNDSKDNSCQLASEAGWFIEPISSDGWSWGKAINVGVGAVPETAEFVLILSADVSPSGSTTLRDLCLVLERQSAAGVVFPRQLPRADAPFLECVRLGEKFGSVSMVARANGEVEMGAAAKAVSLLGSIPMSNAAALYRRELLVADPFDEGVAAEEGPWCARLVGAGFEVRYEASVTVLHSHNEAVVREILRLVDLELNSPRPRGRWRSGVSLFSMPVRLPLRLMRLVGRANNGRRKWVMGLLRSVLVGIGCGCVGLLVLLGLPISRIREALW